MPPRFALFGTAAAVADRHLRAIADVGGELVAAADPAGMPGSARERFPDARAFEDVEACARYLGEVGVDYVVVCTPNDLHPAHATLGLELGATVICEKPIALHPAELDRLALLEARSTGRIAAILQLRQHPEIVRMAVEARGEGRHAVVLDYVLARGPEFHASWHGREDRSGGLIFEIGIHFLDLLTAIFGDVEEVQVAERRPERVTGTTRLARADVRWRLSVDPLDIPAQLRDGPNPSLRQLTVDGRTYDLARGGGTVGLHTKLYKDILAGGGYTLADARPGIDLAARIRAAVPAPSEAIR